MLLKFELIIELYYGYINEFTIFSLVMIEQLLMYYFYVFTEIYQEFLIMAILNKYFLSHKNKKFTHTQKRLI